MGVVTAFPHTKIFGMDAPDLYTYLDYRRFLRDWFDWKKASNPRYSHRLFAKKAGQRSPSLLLLVMDGRRNLTAQTTAAFVAAMGLDEGAARFFSLLVRFDQAESSEERAALQAEILATRGYREARQVDAAAVRYFENWYFPAIHELAQLAAFRPDPAWIASALVPPIRPVEAAEALDALLVLGLLAPDGDGVPRPTDASVVTPHEVLESAFTRYHLGMLERARESVRRFPQPERHVLGLTVSIPVAMLPEVKARLNEIQRELLALCDKAPRERVYQLSIAFFPLSGGGSCAD